MRRPGRVLLFVGIAIVLVAVLGDTLVQVYTDALWYASLGYAGVYWTRLGIAAAVRVGVGIVGAALVLLNLWFVARQLGPVHLRRRYGNLEIAERVPRGYLMAGIVVTALLAGWWLSGVAFGGDGALALAAWLRQVPWGARDPLLERDLGFYVFSLPAYFALSDFLLITVIWSALLAALGYVLVGSIRWRDNKLHVSPSSRLHFLLLAAALLVIIGLRYWLGRYALLVEGSGFGGTLGYTDVHARLPARGLLAVLALIAAGSLVYGGLRHAWRPPAVGVGALVIAAIAAGSVYPGFVQKFQVDPNQLAREGPYIGWSLDFTRRAYGLDKLQRKLLPYRRGAVPTWDALRPSLAQLPLWDAAPLEKVLNQLQTGYGYYHFPQADFDRYGVGDGLQQVAIAAREFYPEGLPPSSRNWLTLKLNPKYVRGMGAVVSPSAAATPQGQPVLWLSNFDPITRNPAAPPDVALTNPSLFIGQSMTDYVVIVPGRGGAFRGRAGVDYPEGVRLGSWLRLLAYAWRFGDKNLLFSSDLTDDSRILFWRSVGERVEALAPFLVWDPDPYPVLAGGHIVWIADGYTASATFPLSRMQEVEGAGQLRYLHSSVKAVIDGVTGATTLYAIAPGDPVLDTYRRLFPTLVRPWEALPPEVRAHIRYPRLYFDTQALVLRQFHLTSPETFFGGQDVWELPPESVHEAAARTYEASYAMMRLPGEPRPEFLLSTPFIARQRQNMTAELFARSDGDQYGELVLYELPRDVQIPGPGQVQALIEQNPVISPQLTLWRQSGSNVDLGHLRVVPLDSGFLYIQPLFLSQSSTTGGGSQAIPELSRIVASDGSAVGMDSTLAGSIEALRGVAATTTAVSPVLRAAGAGPAILPATGDWPAQALRLLDQADARLRAGDFAGFGAAWKQLRAVLDAANKPHR